MSSRQLENHNKKWHPYYKHPSNVSHGTPLKDEDPALINLLIKKSVYLIIIHMKAI